MSSGVLVPLGLFVLVFAWIGFLAIRRPLLARLAAREAIRRRGQTLLVVAGLMVGTATITAALVGGDSVEDSAVESFAYRNWGHIDLTVRRGDNGFFPPSVARRMAQDPDVRAVTDGVSPGIEVFGAVSNLDRRLGTSGVVLAGFDPKTQGPFGAFRLTDGTETTGADLGPREVILSRLLANKIDARVGDRLRLVLESAGGLSPGGPSRPPELVVGGIARAEPPGSYTLGAVVFAPMPVAREVVGTRLINLVRVSVPGGIRDTEDAALAAEPAIEDAVLQAGGRRLLVSQAKLLEVDNAKTLSEFFRAMLVGMSGLVVAAGSALIVNLIGMLAEERRSRLGVLRALGLKRKRLVTMSVIEGALYSLAAGVLGVVVGLPAGRLIAQRFGQAFAQFAGDDFDFQFHFVLRPGTLVTAFAVGTLLTLLVVWISARRTSRLTITAAIRDLPEPADDQAHRRWPARLRLLGLAGLGVAGLVSGPGPARTAGGLALILAVSLALRGRVSARLLPTLTGLALAGWSFFQVSSIAPDEDAGQFFGTFVMALLAAVFGLTILASANLRIAERIGGLFGRARQAMLRPPLAYLARRPVRTGLTTGVFAIVIAMLAMFSVFFVIFEPEFARFSNGYDVRVLSTGSADIRLPAGIEADVERSLQLPTVGYVGPFKGEAGFGDSDRTLVPLFVVDVVTARNQPPVRLDLRDEAYDTDADVWEALASDPNLTVTAFGNPGQTIRLAGDSGPVEFTVAGTPTFGLLDGMYVSDAAATRFRSAPVGASMLLDVRDGVDALEFARRIEARLFEQGVEADSIQELADNASRANRAIFSTIDILMRMGLIIGVLSLGIVALRVITERRHSIGVLRAIGYKRRSVMGGLVAEAGVTVTIGALVGCAVGITMGWLFYQQQDSQPGFGLDWGNLGGALALVLVSVLLVTLGPAWRASRLPPAEAVRYSE